MNKSEKICLNKENVEEMMIKMGFIRTKDNNMDKIEFMKAWKLLEKMEATES